MRIFLLLIISLCKLSAINISTDGLGRNSKWNIKGQTGQQNQKLILMMIMNFPLMITKASLVKILIMQIILLI